MFWLLQFIHRHVLTQSYCSHLLRRGCKLSAFAFVWCVISLILVCVKIEPKLLLLNTPRKGCS